MSVEPAYGSAMLLMLGALALFLVLFLVYLWQSGWGRGGAARTGPAYTLRPIAGYEAANEGLALSAETGRSVHTSPGTGSIGAQGVGSAATLAGMAVVESMARVSAITGAPVQATTNDAIAYLLTDNALRRGARRAGWSLDSEGGDVRFMTHADPLAYVAGATDVVEGQKVSSAVMVGQFGPEVLILTEVQRRNGAQQIIGASDHQALALINISADHTLIGEEIFASGAYLERRTTHIAALLAQDGLRWAVIVLIVLGFIIGNALGINWNEVVSVIP
ncbi:MAG: DUF6754 domain-containing protein [Chloroflexia bacterium]